MPLTDRMSAKASTPPPRTKLKIRLDPAEWHNYRVENLWVDLLDDGTCEIRNVPFYAYGLSLGDRVKVDFRDGELWYVERVASAGHSTFRIIVPKVFDKDAETAFAFRWAALQALGCTYESTGAPRNLFAVDVPPRTDMSRVTALLDAGVSDRTWDYERSSPP
jgi:hypothetical protein